MATHFLTETSAIACGKATAPDCSSDAEKVTCKNCLRSQAYVQRPGAQAAQQAAEVAPAPVAAPVVAEAVKPALSVVPAGSGKPSTVESRKAKHAPQKQVRGVAFAEWRARFGENDRLPRGKAFAAK